MKQHFLDDTQKLYDYLTNKKKEVNRLYEFLETNDFESLTLIEEFASFLSLSMSDDLRVALTTRLLSLRDDMLVQVLKKRGFEGDELEEKIELAYQFVAQFWNHYHEETIGYIYEHQLFTPFYRAIFRGVYEVGLAMTDWQTQWTKVIINGVNKALIKEFGSDEKVMEYLACHNLFDKGHDQLQADRSYSVLVKNSDGVYESKAYIVAFPKEVRRVIDALESLSDQLIELEDEVFDQKWNFVRYIQTIITALSEKRCDELVRYWSEVDRAWMEITTPIQIGHPLEYYEDHYRKAVALEWDIRLANPAYTQDNQRASKLRTMSQTLYALIDGEGKYKASFDFCQKSLGQVQLYIGRPALFFGAEYNGLFSAQVVPNDEKISKTMGKKIFAFSDEVLQGARAKPFLQLSREIFGEDFLKEERKFLFQKTQEWHKVYDITTIGHEFGHILWCDEESETVMNHTGNFKNIEEFKATTGGLVSFFLDSSSEEGALLEYVINDTIKRAVGLIGWMEVDEVQPYYCEGIIHLFGLFSSGVLRFDTGEKKLHITKDTDQLEQLKAWYIETYKSLAKHYLIKQDASLWLYQFMKKDGEYFLPNDENLKSFVLYYFERYKEIGTQIDFSDKKENYC